MSRTRRPQPVVEPLEDRSLLSVTLLPLGTYSTGVFNAGAAEIVAHDPQSQRVFSVNGDADRIDILSIRNPRRPTLVGTLDVSALGSPNSVAVDRNVVAVAVENADVQAPGKVAFYSTHGQFLSAVTVGALPDMLTFSADGRSLLVANEGEPEGYLPGQVDPEGSVSIIAIPRGLGNIKKLTDADVRTVSFGEFNGQEDALRTQGIRIFGPGASAAEDFEPEYITVSADSRTAYVTLQENNAVAVIDVGSATVVRLMPLGTKDHNVPPVATSGLDASDRDGLINIRNWPVSGLYLPDAIASYTVGGQTYLVTANEGDARDYDGLTEESRVKDLDLEAAAFPGAADLQQDGNLGRLTVTNTLGDADGDGEFDQLFSFGTRSFSIRRADGTLVYDSGSDFERITAERLPAFFNADHTSNSFDNRSDNKGPETEAVTLGVIGGRTYAFVGLERIGGVMVYDVTDPESPSFVDYVNNRDFTGDPEAGTAGDLGPEGIIFIAASDSPVKVPLLVVANEVSGTVTVYGVVPPLLARLLRAVELDASVNAEPGDTLARSARGGDGVSADLALGLLRGGHGSRGVGPALARSAGHTLLPAGDQGTEAGRASRLNAVVAFWEHASRPGKDADEMFADLFAAL